MSILKTQIDLQWDDRFWELAQKAENPGKMYRELTAVSESGVDSSEGIDDLPREKRDWLRAT